jgi:hypothetical protein
VSKPLPDHTPATLGDVRAVPVPTLATLLAQADKPCETCEHISRLPVPDREPCDECDGSGRVLTADGSALVGFLAQHGFWPTPRRADR